MPQVFCLFSLVSLGSSCLLRLPACWGSWRALEPSRHPQPTSPESNVGWFSDTVSEQCSIDRTGSYRDSKFYNYGGLLLTAGRHALQFAQKSFAIVNCSMGSEYGILTR